MNRRISCAGSFLAAAELKTALQAGTVSGARMRLA